MVEKKTVMLWTLADDQAAYERYHSTDDQGFFALPDQEISALI